MTHGLDRSCESKAILPSRSPNAGNLCAGLARHSKTCDFEGANSTPTAPHTDVRHSRDSRKLCQADSGGNPFACRATPVPPPAILSNTGNSPKQRKGMRILLTSDEQIRPV